jgi:cysteine-rich repeat protein
MKTLKLVVFVSLLAACATDSSEVDADPVACEGKCDDAFGRRTTAEICGAVDPRWGDDWSLPDTTGDKQANATDAMACANRLFWASRYRPFAVHHKFYLHKWICETNPASHYAMNDEQREFYCSLSLHFRMCNTQGLYAIANVPDSLPRRERENAIFSKCLTMSGELPYFRDALQMDGASDTATHGAVARLYDDYKVQPGLRVAPPVVNPDRAAVLLFERLARISFYGLTVPLELLESTFSNLFLTLDPLEHESQIRLILYFRSELVTANLLDVSGMPTCGDGRLEPGEQCDDGNTSSNDGCTSYCTIES